MNTVYRPQREKWSSLIVRPKLEIRQLEVRVRTILDAVRTSGITAIREFTRKFDGYDPVPLAVSDDEFDKAVETLDEKLKSSIQRAAANIDIFHRNQQREHHVVYISKSIQCWQKDLPIDSVGLYIPGGTASLFSTVLMLGIPAKIAGCREVILCTPARKDGSVNPAVLFAARLCGIDKVYRLGGVQAIAAMAYGAEGVQRVDKIYGPGNQYVTLAKQLVSEDGLAIDMPAGPSEVLVIADETANPEFVAADLLSQAEHGADSQVVLICQSLSFADKVRAALDDQLEQLPRKEIARAALENSLTVVFDSIEEMIEFSNRYAPEHLIMCIADARQNAEKVCNAGSVFIGHYTPESAGDYASGTNHTLPTNGYARSYSGLNLQSFMKTIQYQEIRADGLSDLGPDIIAMAEAEGLQAHARAVEIRINKDKKS